MRRTANSEAHIIGRPSWSQTIAELFRVHLRFIGPGLVAAIAYCDPGNWATDLTAGSLYGYAHLFVILSASLMAIVLQVLAARLGYITGKDLAEHCRNKFYDRPRHKKLWRWGCLYPLYILCEGGIIFTDLAELLGSAMALHLLFPRMPLFVGVLLTSADVFLVLAFFNSYPSCSQKNRRSLHLFECCLAALVAIVLVCFVVLLSKVKPVWGNTFMGFLPSRSMIADGGLYVAVSLIGATVMPHSIFLGSKVAVFDRLGTSSQCREAFQADGPKTPDSLSSPLDLECSSSPDRTLAPRPPDILVSAPCSLHSLQHLRKHLAHAGFDIAVSLISLALPINAAILIVAAAIFHSDESRSSDQAADINTAYQLLSNRVAVAAAYIFAIALLLSGQAASITVTLAGQIVSEGFLEWRTNPVVRRLVTRLIGIVPCAIVAASAGLQGVDTLLVASQVALCLVLPFVLAPLIIFTSDPNVMSVTVICSQDYPLKQRNSGGNRFYAQDLMQPVKEKIIEDQRVSEVTAVHSFENSLLSKVVTWSIFVLCTVSNLYAIIQLAQSSA
ncbi:hypothetical protein O181_011321 [Austropuccinia psidii MF-1]|uniref:Uncharacterized protein n=1 Tax=Austropuccinia psidii MF-1 TaxID=1389203 RepID=A0A9Q3BVJ5_9BASI|nr:hypothetical protein [Austropuccinia psidii MF-1]